MDEVKRMVDCLVKGKSVHEDENEEDDFEEEEGYRVHVAVLTACVGKKMPITHGNIMARTLDAAMKRRGGSFAYVTKKDEVGFEMFYM